MGTLGGWLGFFAGIIVAIVSFMPAIDIILGPCFLEEGCSNEGLGLLIAGLGSLACGAMVGLAVRIAVNRLLHRTDR